MKTLIITIVVIAVFCLIAVAADTGSNATITGYQTEVANDFEQQYDMAKRHGSDIDVCVRAGLVAEGHLQAQNEALYEKWRAIQRQDCAKAGLPI